MKTIKIIGLLTVVFSFYACTTNLEDVMSATDIAALQAMEAAYTTAGVYNDSLATYIETTGITNDEACFYFDDMYHQYDSMFAANHNMYSHNNSGDDHSGDSWMMGSGWMNGTNGGHMGNNGHMGNGFNANFCTSENLDLMDSLMNAHENYHPGN